MTRINDYEIIVYQTTYNEQNEPIKIIDYQKSYAKCIAVLDEINQYPLSEETSGNKFISQIQQYISNIKEQSPNEKLLHIKTFLKLSLCIAESKQQFYLRSHLRNMVQQLKVLGIDPNENERIFGYLWSELKAQLEERGIESTKDNLAEGLCEAIQHYVKKAQLYPYPIETLEIIKEYIKLLKNIDKPSDASNQTTRINLYSLLFENKQKPMRIILADFKSALIQYRKNPYATKTSKALSKYAEAFYTEDHTAKRTNFLNVLCNMLQDADSAVVINNNAKENKAVLKILQEIKNCFERSINAKKNLDPVENRVFLNSAFMIQVSNILVLQNESGTLSTYCSGVHKQDWIQQAINMQNTINNCITTLTEQKANLFDAEARQFSPNEEVINAIRDYVDTLTQTLKTMLQISHKEALNSKLFIKLEQLANAIVTSRSLQAAILDSVFALNKCLIKIELYRILQQHPKKFLPKKADKDFTQGVTKIASQIDSMLLVDIETDINILKENLTSKPYQHTYIKNIENLLKSIQTAPRSHVDVGQHNEIEEEPAAAPVP